MVALAVSRRAFERNGLAIAEETLPPAVWRPLVEATEALRRNHAAVRPELLSGIHNPWGSGARLTDPWRFLDAGEGETIVAAVAALLGPDLVLWDSELVLRPRDRGEEGGWRGPNPAWPVEPPVGLTVRIPLDGPVALRYLPGSHREPSAAQPEDIEGIAEVLPPGRPAFADLRLAWRHVPEAPFAAEYVLRYMPATSRYNRDPRAPANRVGALKAPLINYARRPIWLVRGQDRAGNDFVTGFAPATPVWSSATW